MTYRVYVIELDRAAVRGGGSGQPAVYVAQTAHSPEERFAQHKRGYRASRVVHRHGRRLLPELYGHLAPVETRNEAEALERETAERLKGAGYAVYGGH